MVIAIRFFDMFAGIGGFRSGLEQAGGFKCVGFCEIDRHAAAAYKAIYNTEKEVYYNDISRIDTAGMPDFDLLVGGLPCQPYSVASANRRGLDDPRGALFFEFARIIGEKRPAAFFVENVPFLLSHNSGETFEKILGTFSELGYYVEWMVILSILLYTIFSKKSSFFWTTTNIHRAKRSEYWWWFGCMTEMVTQPRLVLRNNYAV